MKLKDVAVAVGVVGCLVVMKIDKEVIKGMITGAFIGIYAYKRWFR